MISENPGTIRWPKDNLSKGINNSTILNELAQGVEILSSQIMDKDYLIIEEIFVHQSIKNVQRQRALDYLSFQYCNNTWIPETGFQWYEEIQLIDKGSIILVE